MVCTQLGSRARSCRRPGPCPQLGCCDEAAARQAGVSSRARAGVSLINALSRIAGSEAPPLFAERGAGSAAGEAFPRRSRVSSPEQSCKAGRTFVFPLMNYSPGNAIKSEPAEPPRQPQWLLGRQPPITFYCFSLQRCFMYTNINDKGPCRPLCRLPFFPLCS